MCEFPTIDVQKTGKKYTNSFVSCKSDSSNLFTRIANINIDKQSIAERDFGKNLYPGENIHITSSNNREYLINTVYNGEKDKTDVHIMDAKSLEDIAVLEMPEALAYSFHGAWNDNTNNNI